MKENLLKKAQKIILAAKETTSIEELRQDLAKLLGYIESKENAFKKIMEGLELDALFGLQSALNTTRKEHKFQLMSKELFKKTYFKVEQLYENAENAKDAAHQSLEYALTISYGGTKGINFAMIGEDIADAIRSKAGVPKNDEAWLLLFSRF